jgi:PBP1b-binding outer membrane lipoprotein LpoB
MKRLFLALTMLIAACSPDEPVPPERAAPEGRAETQSIRNTDAVGTGGAAIADKIDTALDKNEEAEKKLKEEADRQAE